MRHPLTPMFVAALLAAACTSADRSLASHAQFDHTQDLDGTPDLIVDSKALATSWVVYDQELKESFCTLQEGGVPAGKHRVLRFTVTTPNIGTADVSVGDPNRHWDPNGDGDGSDSDGLFENNACRFLDPATGVCHALLESDYSNNVGEVAISIPDHPGKKGWGPGGGQDPVDELIDDENRPDK